jgi:alpha-1,2-mannosyltransferase
MTSKVGGSVRARTAALVGAAGVLLVAVSWLVLSWRAGAHVLTGYRIDLEVYRLGADVWRHGGELYGPLPELRTGVHLSFTYPPISAVLLTPLALVPFEVASAATVVLTAGLLALVLVVVLRSLDVSPWPAAIVLLAPALLVEPVRSTLDYGQVNVVLMALVVLDTLVRTPRWPRGALVGIAAAVKLTPAVFVLFFLLRGDRRAALTAAMSFLLVTGAGFVLAGRDSVQYWTSTVFDTGRIGGVLYISNQSITAFLGRLGIGSTAVWAVLAVAVLAAAAVGMRRAFASGRHTWALSLNALGALPVSPISWSHHWVWAVPVLVTAGVGWWRSRSREALALTSVGTLLFILSPHWWWDRSHPWDLWRMLTGNAYLYFAVLVVASAANGHLRALAGATGPGRTERSSPPPRGPKVLEGAGEPLDGDRSGVP